MFVMKRIITLLLLFVTAFSYQLKAQPGTVCNADFSFSYLSANTVKFTPVVLGDSINTQHFWSFGNGHTSTLPLPTHTYTAAGTYSVTHFIIRYNPNGVAICADTVIKQLVIQSVPQPCNLQAFFTWSSDSINYLKKYFTNATVNVLPSDSVRWTFGDGTSVSGLQSNAAVANPVHIYANAGTYNVCLRVKRNSNTGTTPCVSEICKTVTATVPCNLVAGFTFMADSTQPLRFLFTQTSSIAAPTDSVRWSFGDGTVINGLMSNAAIANPAHTYAGIGVYTVCLRIKRSSTAGTAPCVSEICKTVTVTTPCNLTAAFVSIADSIHPLRVLFINTSTPAAITDSVRWTFGDGTSVSGLHGDPNVANPTHNYAQGGTYTVCLRIKRNINSSATPCVREICKTVVVAQPCNIQVNFSMHRDSLNPRKVHFTNLTSILTTNAIAKWTFGDGATATSWNAVHEYAQPGTYIVCLTVQTSNTCIKTSCDTIVIAAPLPDCRNLSKFRFEKFTGDNQKYKFIPEHISTATQYTWTFGDGTGSHDPIATHRYAQPGIYTACLTAWNGPNCASTTCKEIRVLPQLNCDSINVSYTWQRDPFVPNKIYFYANANFPVLDQTWTITKLSLAATPPVILHQNNPSYVFSDTGYYRVCLKAITLGGCVKEYCSVIRIENLATACLLQAYPGIANSVVNVAVTLTQPQMIHAYVYTSTNVLVREKHQQGVTGNNVLTFSISTLPAGLYTIKVIYGNKTCYARFTKQ
jgi:PKD repeat protein